MVPVLLPCFSLVSATSNSYVANPIQAVAVFQFLGNPDVVTRMNEISTSIY